MSTEFLPSTEQIAVAFGEEILALGGTVSDRYDQDGQLFMRALLPRHGEVRPGDGIQAGIALRALGPLLSVHPYTFRQICANGAIEAHVNESRYIARVEFASATEFVDAALEEIRLTTRRCAAPEVFDRIRTDMRRASAAPAELMIQVLPLLERLPAHGREHLLAMLVQEFARENDETLYGVMNAITAVARETQDPAIRWQLEEYGGALPALAPKMPPAREAERELVAV
jgi:hypothetical protein